MEKISEHVTLLRVTDGDWTFSPALIYDGTELILVDTCYLHQYENLKEEIVRAGFAMSDLTQLILTHQDGDHMAAARAVRGDAPRLRVLAHRLEAPCIDGSRLPIKLAAMGINIEAFSPVEMARYKQRKSAIDNGSTAVEQILEDGDVLPWCGGMEVIHTPGHTPGHISLFVREDGVLIPGDALLRAEGGEELGNLVGPMGKVCQDIDEAMQSLRRFHDFPIQKVACFHGGVFEGDVQVALWEIENVKGPYKGIRGD